MYYHQFFLLNIFLLNQNFHILFHTVAPFLSKSGSGQPVQPLVAKIQDHVSAHHGEIKEVKEQDVPLLPKGGHIRGIQEFGRNTRDIAHLNEDKEKQALALGGSRVIGFIHVKRPGRAKAQNHNDLQNFGHTEVPPNV